MAAAVGEIHDEHEFKRVVKRAKPKLRHVADPAPLLYEG